MANQWFKFYGGDYLADPKMAALTPQERSCWLTLMCLASMATEQGSIGFLTVEVLLSKSGIHFDPYNPEEWNNNLGVLKKFESMRMLKLKEDGCVVIKNWEKRQEHNLTVAERVAKHRQNKVRVTTDVTNVTTEENRVEENRVNTTSKVRTLPVTIVQVTDEDKELKPKGKPKYPNKEAVFSLFPHRERGWDINTTECKYAELLFAEKGLEDIASALRFHEKHKNEPFFPEISKPSELYNKWSKLEAKLEKNG